MSRQMSVQALNLLADGRVEIKIRVSWEDGIEVLVCMKLK